MGVLYRGGWFKLSPEPEVRSFSPEYHGDKHLPFTGARTLFKADVLKLDFPILGRAFGAKKGDVFQTHLASFLIREPTHQECDFFNSQRYEALKRLINHRLPSSFGAIPPTYLPGDNGC